MKFNSLLFSIACLFTSSLQLSPAIAINPPEGLAIELNADKGNRGDRSKNTLVNIASTQGNEENVAIDDSNSISNQGQINSKPLVFLLMGQSNACGTEDIGDTTNYLTQHPNVRKYIQSTTKEGEQFTESLVPFCEKWYDHNSNGKASLMNTFLQKMVEQYPQQKFDVLNCSIPGSSIQSYEKGKAIEMNFYGNNFQTGDSNIYEHCVRRTKEVLEQGGGILAGVLFHQGETDNSASYWKPAVENVVRNFRQDLNSDVPFIFGHIVPIPENENHNQIVDSLKDTSNGIGVVSSQNLSYQSDRLHFDEQGSLGLGLRYAEEMLKFLNPETNSTIEN